MSYQNRFFTQNLHQLKHQLKNQIGMNKDLPFEEMCTHINYTFRIFMKSVQLEYWYFKVDTQGSQLDNSLLFVAILYHSALLLTLNQVLNAENIGSL